MNLKVLALHFESTSSQGPGSPGNEVDLSGFPLKFTVDLKPK